MRSCCTRSTNLKGPAQTGLRPNLSPASFAALGLRIMPARSASWAISGENGFLSSSRTVVASATSTLSTAASSGLRNEPCMVMCRSRLALTASASIASPSWNLTPGRSLMVTVLAVLGGLVRQRQLRHDVELVVDVEQLVAQRREHDAADVGARQRRVEHVGVLGQADAQRRLRHGCGAGQHERRRHADKSEAFSCDCTPELARRSRASVLHLGIERPK